MLVQHTRVAVADSILGADLSHHAGLVGTESSCEGFKLMDHAITIGEVLWTLLGIVGLLGGIAALIAVLAIFADGFKH